MLANNDRRVREMGTAHAFVDFNFHFSGLAPKGTEDTFFFTIPEMSARGLV